MAKKIDGGPPRPAPEAPAAPTRAPPQQAPARAPSVLRPNLPSPVRLLDGGEKRKPPDGDPAGRAKLGDPRLAPADIGGLTVLHAAEHLMLLLANQRTWRGRAEVLAEVGDLVLGLERPDFVKKVLFAMGESGKIVDIYPLEVMAYVKERRPELLDGVDFAEFIRNKRALESAVHAVDGEIHLEIPVAMKVRAFALSGGGSPGYCFAPGAPGEYVLEMGDAGTFPLLVRGEVRKTSLIDRVTLRVVDVSGVQGPG